MNLLTTFCVVFVFVISGCKDNLGNQDPAGDPDRSSSASGSFKQISLGVGSTRQCSIDENHQTTCWANNNPKGGWPQKNNADLKGKQFDKIAGINDVLCAIDVQGKVQCFNSTEPSKKTPAEIEGLGNYSQVVGLFDRFCALSLGKEIVCHRVDFSADAPADDYASPDEIIEIAAGAYIPAGSPSYSPFGCWITNANKLTCHPFADGPQAAAPAETADRIVKMTFNWVSLMTLSIDKKHIKYFEQLRAIRKDHNIDLSVPHKEIATFRDHLCVLTPTHEIKCGAFNFKTLSTKNDAEVKQMRLKTIHPGVYYCGQNMDDTATCWVGDTNIPFEIPAAIKAP